ncbi:hypothetical protein LX81_02337 [Palleronia aestuarii]|uniref:Uncharacterized protein n=1 Tax=Palleronia aestuarii TaxID=568105 RepID=A0A2W7N8R6_9RHOB|nr:hypothetical protein [Palleronia aestuarii]PZX16063.1 hypothetical protein LX81_02337 [Palleronia aestuarii]
MTGIGHNGGPELSGRGWRRHCWTEARRALLPHLPLNVVRRRVKRAKELGLDYSAYATVRATTGRDIVGFLFSMNALGVLGDGAKIPERRLARVEGITGAARIGLAPESWRRPDALDAWADAPAPFSPWREQARAMDDARGKMPGDAVLLVGAAPWEAAWSSAGRLAGYLSAASYFGDP